MRGFDEIHRRQGSSASAPTVMSELRMTTIRADIQALQRAIRQLSQREREALAEWILNSQDTESRVAEAVVCPYGDRRESEGVMEPVRLEAGGRDPGTDDLLLAWRGYSAAIAELERTSEREVLRSSPG
jgi:hypothetical protein